MVSGIIGLILSYAVVVLCCVLIVAVDRVTHNMWTSGILGSLASLVVWAITMFIIFSVAKKEEKAHK